MIVSRQLLRRPVALAAATLACGFLLGVAGQGWSQPPSRGVAPIYWGALMDGNDTYGSGYEDAPWDARTWRRFEIDAGKRVSIVHWGTGVPWEREFDSFLPAFRAVVGRGDLSLVSMSSGSVPLRDVAAGRYDDALRRWVTQAHQWGHPFFLRWDWEMNGSWFPWGTTAGSQSTPADYVAAWRHFHELAELAGATNITWVWCPNTDYAGATPLGQLYPGDAYVDWTCVDAYNKGRTDWRSFSSLVGPTYRELLGLASTKPIMIAELATEELGGSKAGWIADALGRLPERFPRVRALVWTNWRITEEGRRWAWPIESSRAARRAFARAIAAPYFQAGGRFGGLPAANPITPLRGS